MATGKRYYWMKLKEAFMTSDTIDYFMSQPNGAQYVVLYQMLCLKTINTQRVLRKAWWIMAGREKDPMRQLQGRISKAKGKAFEQRLDDTFEYYRSRGAAKIEKTPEPMRPVRELGNGKFIAFYEKKAQADYKGTLKGGRTIVFEAKYTSTEKMEQSRVTKDQADYIDEHAALGARCYVVIGFDSGEVYCIPWDVWTNMKALFGRKYVKETDIQKYRVKSAWNGALLLLG